MFEFLKTPFLPNKRVSHVLVAKNCEDVFCEPLKRLGIETVSSPYCNALPSYLRYHPDMNCRHLGGKKFAVFHGAENLEPLLSLGADLIFVDPPKASVYPFDAALNVLPLEDRLIFNPKTADRALLEMLSDKDLIHVKQGYTACSIAVLGDKLVLTGDEGICKALALTDIKAVRVNSGGIKLSGVANGFIGGSAGLIAPYSICFSGRTEGILDKAVLEGLGFTVTELLDGKMTDVGGIVPIMQVSE